MAQIIGKWGYLGGFCQKFPVPGMVWGSLQTKVDPGIFRASQNLGGRLWPPKIPRVLPILGLPITVGSGLELMRARGAAAGG